MSETRKARDGRPLGWEIRHAEEAHLGALPEIEKAAADLFSERDLPAGLRNDTLSGGELLDAVRQGLLLVALEDGRPVAFALAKRFGGSLHLQEMDVHPRVQRRGIGSALLAKTFEMAREKGCEAVTLTTFRHVPWNAPWYRKQGFEALRQEELPPWLRSILAREEKQGLDPRRRVAMRAPLPKVPEASGRPSPADVL